MTRRKKFPFLLALVLLVTPLIAGHAAGGQISGTITDPKGALVAGAQVMATSASGQKFTATTDQQGRYKIEGLAPGVYVVTVTAKGFSEARRESVAVADNQTAALDVKLEIAPLANVGVTVGESTLKGNSDPVYVQLRQRSASQDVFAGDFATVNNLVLKRDAATFTLKSGEIYFMTPVEGRTIAAVFIGEGEVSLTPPIEVEQKALSLFTKEPSLKEEFTQLVLRFTDKTFDEIKQSPNVTMGKAGSRASQARDLYRDKETLLRKQLRINLDSQTLADLYTPERTGYFFAFINGRRWSKLIYMLDPLGISFVSPEEVALYSYGDSDGGFWTSFHLADEYKQGTTNSTHDTRHFDITHHEIEGAIKGTKITATDRVTLRPMIAGARVLPFSLYRTLRVKAVQDGEGRELNFIQEDKDEDAAFAVIFPQALEKGKDYQVLVQYEGEDALRDAGGGNYILIPRSTWYPNNGGTQFGDRATFDITFRYPKGNLFVGTGALAGAETQDKDAKIAKWTSGKTELAVAGFNYGDFKREELSDPDSGYNLEFYANKELPAEMKQLQLQIEQAENLGAQTNTTLGSMSTTGMAKTALNDAQNAMRIYNAYFGKLAYTRVAMTQQPAGNFGQAWPTLVYMPYIAYLDSTQRTQLMGIRGGTDTFWKYVGPHEIAHQWWGHMVGWKSYRDQWMSEGFAEFSTSLYVMFVRKDINKFTEFWEDQRRRIVEATQFTNGIKPYTVGPITQGFRLSNSKTRAAYQFLVYPKGAYILHMIRMMMYDQRGGGDAKFRAMMADFIQSHYNQDVSTEDFKAAVEKHMTPQMDVDKNGRMDWFFNQWVYGTDVPSYKMDYSIAPTGDGKAVINAKVTQSGVSKDFVMLVPVYADFGKGWVRLGSALINGNSTTDLSNLQLPQAPKRLAVAALNDVLATSVENNKK